MKTLDDIIDNAKDAREIKRAIAVKMVSEGFEVEIIVKILNISDSYISKWKVVYEEEGAEGLAVAYKGSKSYLTENERKEVISFLKEKKFFRPEELRDFLESEYKVVYRSKQSYYDLLHEGGIGWKKSENANPKRDEEQIAAERENIRNTIKEHEEEIKKGRVAVLAEDESHLLWGDTLGYVWARKNEKAEVPMTNERERQTYYGAVNIFSGEFHVKPYESGNGENTVSFVKHLQEVHKDLKIILIWDRASYHRYGEMRKYLGEVNQGLAKEDWKVTCVQFAPNAPDQNPVEDIWRQSKNFLRRHFYENKTFEQVKTCFLNFLNGQSFNFPKLKLYTC